jgi:hypothetical protein
MQNITKVGCNTYLYNTTNITQSEETSSHNNGKIDLPVFFDILANHNISILSKILS